KREGEGRTATKQDRPEEFQHGRCENPACDGSSTDNPASNEGPAPTCQLLCEEGDAKARRQLCGIEDGQHSWCQSFLMQGLIIGGDPGIHTEIDEATCTEHNA